MSKVILSIFIAGILVFPVLSNIHVNAGNNINEIIINFAGNPDDEGGPYWLPSGESDCLEDEGYYTNDSRQIEDWIYIHLTVIDADGVDSVWLHWYNRDLDSWINDSYQFVNSYDNYWEFNSKNIIDIESEHDYSFDVMAIDLLGNTYLKCWEKTGLGESLTRRYVTLGCVPIDISYKAYYFYDASYTISDQNSHDRLHHDQGIDGTTHDTGYLLSDIPTDIVQNRWCTCFVVYWFDENTCINSFKLKNIYYHFWYSTDDTDIEQVGWYKQRNNPSTEIYNYYRAYDSDYRSEIETIEDGRPSYLNPTPYYLNTHLLNVNTGNHYFTDNDIYELNIKIDTSLILPGTYPSIINNRSFTSFVLLNVPNNSTLNASYSDSDLDGLSDWTELFVAYTNPFISDTDNDSIDDYHECIFGSDPNNYKETFTDANKPNKPNTPSGITNGQINVKYDFSTSTTDPNGDTVKYAWDWNGDGIIDEWDDNNGQYYSSGAIITTYHSWAFLGLFNVKVMAQDINGIQSEWSDPLNVSMTKSKTINTMPFLQRFFENLPYLFPILRQLLELYISSTLFFQSDVNK